MSKPEGGPKRPETAVVTAGRKPFDHHGLVNPPVYHASTLLHRTVEALEKDKPRYTYGRRLTPTIEALQDAMDKHDVPFRAQNKLLALLAPMHRDIVEK